jgi:DNA-binding NarL/FixJ family response regulator
MTSTRDCGFVLIADDDTALLALLGEALGSAGYATRAATSGDAALALAAAEPPVAAVIDVNLPVRSGYEVCRELRRRCGRSLPILFVSGERTQSYDRIGGLLHGADAYLVKPLDPGELIARLDTLLRRGAPPAANGRLTPRELEVLTLLAHGFHQAEIAKRLEITSKTVATHIERVLGKLGVHSRAQAVAVAYRDTLVGISA